LITVFSFNLLDSPAGSVDKPSYKPHAPPIAKPVHERKERLKN